MDRGSAPKAPLLPDSKRIKEGHGHRRRRHQILFGREEKDRHWRSHRSGTHRTAAASARAHCVARTVQGRPRFRTGERGFYESAFTLANVDRLMRYTGGFEGLWSDLAGKHTHWFHAKREARNCGKCLIQLLEIEGPGPCEVVELA